MVKPEPEELALLGQEPPPQVFALAVGKPQDEVGEVIFLPFIETFICVLCTQRHILLQDCGHLPVKVKPTLWPPDLCRLDAFQHCPGKGREETCETRLWRRRAKAGCGARDRSVNGKVELTLQPVNCKKFKFFKGDFFNRRGRIELKLVLIPLERENEKNETKRKERT